MVKQDRQLLGSGQEGCKLQLLRWDDSGIGGVCSSNIRSPGYCGNQDWRGESCGILQWHNSGSGGGRSDIRSLGCIKWLLPSGARCTIDGPQISHHLQSQASNILLLIKGSVVFCAGSETRPSTIWRSQLRVATPPPCCIYSDLSSSVADCRYSFLRLPLQWCFLTSSRRRLTWSASVSDALSSSTAQLTQIFLLQMNLSSWKLL